MVSNKNLPKIVFSLSLISFCITLFWGVTVHFSNLNVKILLALQPITLVLLGFSMYFSRNSRKIYSIMSIILFLITFNLEHIMYFILVYGVLIWKKKIYQQYFF